jgi:hypothetical protein
MHNRALNIAVRGSHRHALRHPSSQQPPLRMDPATSDVNLDARRGLDAGRRKTSGGFRAAGERSVRAEQAHVVVIGLAGESGRERAREGKPPWPQATEQRQEEQQRKECEAEHADSHAHRGAEARPHGAVRSGEERGGGGGGGDRGGARKRELRSRVPGHKRTAARAAAQRARAKHRDHVRRTPRGEDGGERKHAEEARSHVQKQRGSPECARHRRVGRGACEQPRHRGRERECAEDGERCPEGAQAHQRVRAGARGGRGAIIERAGCVYSPLDAPWRRAWHAAHHVERLAAQAHPRCVRAWLRCLDLRLQTRERCCAAQAPRLTLRRALRHEHHRCRGTRQTMCAVLRLPPSVRALVQRVVSLRCSPRRAAYVAAQSRRC